MPQNLQLERTTDIRSRWPTSQASTNQERTGVQSSRRGADALYEAVTDHRHSQSIRSPEFCANAAHAAQTGILTRVRVRRSSVSLVFTALPLLAV